MVAATVLLIGGSCLPAQAVADTEQDWQTAAGGKMSFDVASIRPTKDGDSITPTISMETDDYYPSRSNLFRVGRTVETYIQFAYKLHLTPEQREVLLTNLPGWVSTEKYTIVARAMGTPTKDQMRLMMQTLLSERFGLKLHFEDRTVPVFALVLDKDGKAAPQLHPHAEGPKCDVFTSDRLAAQSANDSAPAERSAEFSVPCRAMALKPEKDQMLLWTGRDISMARLALWIPVVPPRSIGRSVVDQTGLPGTFDFTLEWQPANGVWNDAATQPEVQGRTLEEALKAQLGLRLKATKAAVPFLIVDHVERPTEN